MLNFLDGLKGSLVTKFLYIFLGVCLGFDWKAFLFLDLSHCPS